MDVRITQPMSDGRHRSGVVMLETVCKQAKVAYMRQKRRTLSSEEQFSRKIHESLALLDAN